MLNSKKEKSVVIKQNSQWNIRQKHQCNIFEEWLVIQPLTHKTEFNE